MIPADADVMEPETGPWRRCVVSRRRLPKEEMFRFVIGPDGVLVPDLAARLPGRGLWLSASRDVIEGGRAASDERAGSQTTTRGTSAPDRALVRALARAAGGPVKVPSDLAAALETGLIRRIGDLLGLARRAGQAVAGFEKARYWARRRSAGLLVQAADGSAAERDRFRTAFAATIPVVAPLRGAVLGEVFGRETVVHVVVAAGRLAALILADTGRLARLRGEPDQAADDAMGAGALAVAAARPPRGHELRGGRGSGRADAMEQSRLTVRTEPRHDTSARSRAVGERDTRPRQAGQTDKANG